MAANTVNLPAEYQLTTKAEKTFSDLQTSINRLTVAIEKLSTMPNRTDGDFGRAAESSNLKDVAPEIAKTMDAMQAWIAKQQPQSEAAKVETEEKGVFEGNVIAERLERIEKNTDKSNDYLRDILAELKKEKDSKDGGLAKEIEAGVIGGMVTRLLPGITAGLIAAAPYIGLAIAGGLGAWALLHNLGGNIPADENTLPGADPRVADYWNKNRDAHALQMEPHTKEIDRDFKLKETEIKEHKVDGRLESIDKTLKSIDDRLNPDKNKHASQSGLGHANITNPAAVDAGGGPVRSGSPINLPTKSGATTGSVTGNVDPSIVDGINFFMSKGLTKEQAVGVVARLVKESGGNKLDPTRVNPNSGALGIAQWLGPRQPAAIATGGDLHKQLELVWSEFNSTHKAALRAIQASTSAHDSAVAMEKYEVAQNPQFTNSSADYASDLNTRIQTSPGSAPGAAPVASAVPPPTTARGGTNTAGTATPGALSGVGSGLKFDHPDVDPANLKDDILGKITGLAGQFGGLEITSGYRSPEHNASVGGAEHSQHMQGTAVDVRIPGGDAVAVKLIEAASKSGIGGIGLYNNGTMHLDTGAKRVWGPNYSASSLGQLPKPIQAALQSHMTGKWTDPGAISTPSGTTTTPSPSSASLTSKPTSGSKLQLASTSAATGNRGSSTTPNLSGSPSPATAASALNRSNGTPPVNRVGDTMATKEMLHELFDMKSQSVFA